MTEAHDWKKDKAYIAGGTYTPSPVLQKWMMVLPFMQQTVLISAVRGCDGMPKLHKIKPLLRWYRRCILLSAFDNRAITDPFDPGGGSFTGPVVDLTTLVRSRGEGDEMKYYHEHGWVTEYDMRCTILQRACDDFMDSRDELPSHFWDHAMHAFQIVGYKHPDEKIREFWNIMYIRMVHAKHCWPETEDQLDKRLGDDYAGWAARADESTSCSD